MLYIKKNTKGRAQQSMAMAHSELAALICCGWLQGALSYVCDTMTDTMTK